MKKLVTAYGIIVAIIVVLVIALLTSCSKSGHRVSSQQSKLSLGPAAQDSIQYIRALNLRDSSVTSVGVLRKENVYKRGDKVWVWTRDANKLRIVSLPADIQTESNTVTVGYYARHQLLTVND